MVDITGGYGYGAGTGTTPPATPTTTTGFDLSGMLGNIFSGSGVANMLSGAANLALTESEIQRLRDIGPRTTDLATGLAERAQQAAEFTPYTIASLPGLGGADVSREGIQLETGLPQQRITEQALAGAETALQGLLAPRSEREAAILEAIESARAPMRERERLALEQRLFTQGRGGTQSAMYGGATPEELARQTAIEEQRGRDVLSAMTQAGTEQSQAQQLASNLLGTAYTPQAQALNLLAGSVAPQQIAQSGALAGSEAFAGAIPGIIEATGQGETAAANIRQQQLQDLIGLLAPTTSAAISAQGQQSLGDVIGGSISQGLQDLYNQIF